MRKHCGRRALDCFDIDSFNSSETTWLVRYFFGVGSFVEPWTWVWASSGGTVFTWNHPDEGVLRVNSGHDIVCMVGEWFGTFSMCSHILGF